jgi:hypothetical protein
MNYNTIGFMYGLLLIERMERKKERNNVETTIYNQKIEEKHLWD